MRPILDATPVEVVMVTSLQVLGSQDAVLLVEGSHTERI